MNLGGEIYTYEDGKLIASRALLLLCESSYSSSHMTFARTPVHCLIPSFTNTGIFRSLMKRRERAANK